MAGQDRGIGGWAATLASCAALLLLGLLVGGPALGQSPAGLAWALGLAVTAAFFGLLVVAHDRARAARFARAGGGGHPPGAWARARSHWGEWVRRPRHTWYKGRSHSGERPRYD